MIVVRGFVTVQRGRWDDVVAMLRKMTANNPGAVRIYESFIGDNTQVSVEMEFENLAEYERWDAEYVRNPDALAGFQDWFDLTTAYHSEVWHLAE